MGLGLMIEVEICQGSQNLTICKFLPLLSIFKEKVCETFLAIMRFG